MNVKNLGNLIAIACGLAGELAEVCSGYAPGIPYLIELGFNELGHLIEALPPDTREMEFYRNWARTSRELWASDEGHAAGYQLTQMQRRLGRLQEEWS